MGIVHAVTVSKCLHLGTLRTSILRFSIVVRFLPVETYVDKGHNYRNAFGTVDADLQAEGGHSRYCSSTRDFGKTASNI